jgi:hypothetical protein
VLDVKRSLGNLMERWIAHIKHSNEAKMIVIGTEAALNLRHAESPRYGRLGSTVSGLFSFQLTVQVIF